MQSRFPFTRLLTRAAFALAIAIAAVTFAAPAAQAAGAPRLTNPFVSDVGALIFPAKTLTTQPAGFAVSAGRAVQIAESSPQLRAIHRVKHPLRYTVYVWVGSHYEIYFSYRGTITADVNVLANGHRGATYTGAAIFGVYARGHYGQIFDSPWVWGGLGAMFVLGLAFLRRRSWLDLLDLGMVLGFGVSYVLFDHSRVEPAVWLAYPPLLYLLGRMLWRGSRSRGTRTPLSTRLPLWFLAVGLLALIAVRVYLTLEPSQVMDVGDASVVGAYKILHGQSIYYSSIGHGDTYGPIAYLAYVPFELIWPGTLWNSYLPSARAAPITFDLLTIAGLIWLGVRWQTQSRRAGLKTGLALAWLWAACPFSALGLVKSTNDGLVALFMVVLMLVLTTPVRRGIVVGLATAAKFFPAILLPLIATARRGGDVRDARKTLAGFVLAAGASVALFLPSGGLKEMWDHTLGFQLTRPDIFSPWALHPGLAPVKVAVTVAGALLALLVAWRPRGERSPAQIAALAAALIVAVQLPALHWFYLYIVWFLPLVLVAVFAPDAVARTQPEPEPEAEPPADAQFDHEPELVSA